uniref:Protein kinase domain-containing protein n=1 Tax=Leersia perrieri TaxID=77586 RepID=A0A0D9VE46_9ORYZ
MSPPMLHAAILLVVIAAAASAQSTPSPAPAAAPSHNNHTSNCTVTLPDAEIIFAAFSNVTNFPLPRHRPSCRHVRRIAYPSRGLAGAVNWSALGSLTGLLTVDLSGNSLDGGGFAGGAFWRAPSLRAVDVSRNRLAGALRLDGAGERVASLNVSGNAFTSVVGAGAGAGLEVLDVSRNAIAAVPEGLRRLTRVRHLDLSRNAMSGTFPDDLPPLDGVAFLDISENRFSGVVGFAWVAKFGRAAFLNAGNASSLLIEENPPATMTPSSGGKKHKRVVLIVVVVVVSAVVAVLAAVAFMTGCVACGFERRKKKEKKKAAAWEDDEVAVGAVKVAATAPVVLVERPLMELTLADLAAATSGFGRESQLAADSASGGGRRSGAAYRAVLPDDLHVVVRVVDGGAVAGEDDGEAAAAAGLRELARLRHPNVLPLLGYCIAGKEKLLLYEYMEKGDLYRWLHELPASSMDMEETGADMWDTMDHNKKSIGDWPTRYRIILGIARGLAFLHQGWAGSSGRPIVHGHLVPTNILLSDDLEPRISDYAHPSSRNNNDNTPESDVYSFGVLVFELVTGQVRWDESTVSWARGVIRNRKGLNIVDARLRDGEEETTAVETEAEREMVECLQVGFLCTAHSPEKRPSMQQVVGVLKDIRPAPAAADETP